MSVWSILTTTPTAGLPSSPLTSPSMDEVWARAAPANKRATGTANFSLRRVDRIFILPDTLDSRGTGAQHQAYNRRRGLGSTLPAGDGCATGRLQAFKPVAWKYQYFMLV